MKSDINTISGNRPRIHLQMARSFFTHRGGDDAKSFMIMSSTKSRPEAEMTRGAVIIFKNN